MLVCVSNSIDAKHQTAWIFRLLVMFDKSPASATAQSFGCDTNILHTIGTAENVA